MGYIRHIKRVCIANTQCSSVASVMLEKHGWIENSRYIITFRLETEPEKHDVKVCMQRER